MVIRFTTESIVEGEPREPSLLTVSEHGSETVDLLYFHRLLYNYNLVDGVDSREDCIQNSNTHQNSRGSGGRRYMKYSTTRITEYNIQHVALIPRRLTMKQ